MFLIIILASLALVFHHVAAIMMLEAAAPLDSDVARVTDPIAPEAEPPPASKCDVRSIVYLDQNINNKHFITNTITAQKIELPKGIFELNFNEDLLVFTLVVSVTMTIPSS